MIENELLEEVVRKPILHWNYRNYNELPTVLKGASNIQEIYLKCNNLSSLPPWIGTLNNLTNLYLQHNQLTSLPRTLGDLYALTVLDISDNKIKEIPATVCNLKNLIIFLATKNLLTSLPNDFNVLKKLEVLDLSGNNFSCVPECVCECVALQELLLDSNKIFCLPMKIVYLPSLKTLSLCNNCILYLPMLPFISAPCLLVDDNFYLSYVPLLLNCQISCSNGRNTTYFGNQSRKCEREFSLEELLRRTIIVSPITEMISRINMVMPPTLTFINQTDNQNSYVPSLLEQSMQLIYRAIYYHTIDFIRKDETVDVRTKRILKGSLLFQTLPANVKKEFIKGPTALCFEKNCQKPIFRYAVLRVFLKNCPNERQNKFPILSTIAFCSTNCSRNINNYEIETIKLQNELIGNEIDWYLFKTNSENK